MNYPSSNRRRRHDARAVANYFIERSLEADQPKTPLQILKLVYFSHAWLLGIHGRPLFKQRVEAWKFGPVVADVYHALKQFGGSDITAPIQSVQDDNWTKDEADILRQVAEKYDSFTGNQLSHMTHWPESPWFTTRIERGLGAVIPEDAIRSYFAERVQHS